MKVVSEILGHTSSAITADLYTHVLEDTVRRASDSVSAPSGSKTNIALTKATGISLCDNRQPDQKERQTVWAILTQIH